MRNHTLHHLLAVSILTMLMPSYRAEAQWTIASTQAMGGAGVAAARGVSALASNPANIGIDSSSRVHVSLASFNMIGGNSTFVWNDLRHYTSTTTTEAGDATGIKLSDEERNLLFDQLSGASFAVDVHIQNVAACYNISSATTIAFSSGLDIHALSELPAGMRSLVDGSIGAQPVNVQLHHASFQAYTSLQLSCAHSFLIESTDNHREQLSIGLSVKRLNGLGYASVTPSSFVRLIPFVPVGWDSISNVSVGVEASSQTAGSAFSGGGLSGLFQGAFRNNPGFGLDLGLSYHVATDKGESQYSVSLQDIGTIHWSDVSVRTVNVHDTISSAATLKRSYFDSYSTRSTLPEVTTSLPLRLRLGAAFRWFDIGASECFQISGEYLQGLNTVGSNVTAPRISIGAELGQQSFRPAIRLGAQLGGYSGFLMSVGCGWYIANCVHVDLSAANVGALISPGSSHWISAGFGCAVEF